MTTDITNVMSDRLFRRGVLIILILSALIRLGFLASDQVLPVMWDARRYASAGIALLSYVDTSELDPVSDKHIDRQIFNHYYEKYIQGEKIDWQFYNPHTLTQARDDLYFSGPLYPLVLAFIFYAAPVADFTCVRLFGIVLDIFSTLLLMLIAVRLVGRWAGLIAGALYAIYFPFILTSTMLLLESSTSFLILLTLYILLRGVESGGRRNFLIAGTIIGLLILNKPTAMLLAAPFIAGLFLYTRQTWDLKKYLNRSLMVALPVLVIFLAWLGVTSAKYGQLALRDPTYADANLRQSSSIEFEGYDLDIVNAEFWERDIYDNFIENIPDYLGLLSKKFERMWSRPYNDFKRSFILPYWFGEWVHVVLVSFGLLGLLILASQSISKAGWPFLIIAYYTIIHLIFHSINRYAFNAMPMLIIGFAWFIVLLVSNFVKGYGSNRKLILVALSMLFIGWFIEPAWLSVLGGVSISTVLVVATLIVKTLILMSALYLLSIMFSKDYHCLQRLMFVLIASIVFAVTIWTPALSRDGWAEFACRLDDPQAKAGSKIYISRFQQVYDEDFLTLAIDLNSPSGRQNSFSITIGDEKRNYVGGEPSLEQYFYIKPTYREYAKLEAIGIEHFRQYAIIPVESDHVRQLLDQYGYLEVAVTINDDIKEPDNYITMYGSHVADTSGGYIPSPVRTSIERYVHRGDPRIRIYADFVSDSAVSYYIRAIDITESDRYDLSSVSGKQYGKYNVFLMHFMSSGRLLVY